jgi:hypothetical protein
MSIKCPPVEEVLKRMGFDEETLQTLHKTKEYIAMKVLVMVRNPEITVRLLETPNPIVPHAIVFRQNNLYSIPPCIKLTGKPLNHIS